MLKSRHTSITKNSAAGSCKPQIKERQKGTFNPELNTSKNIKKNLWYKIAD